MFNLLAIYFMTSASLSLITHLPTGIEDNSFIALTVAMIIAVLTMHILQHYTARTSFLIIYLFIIIPNLPGDEAFVNLLFVGAGVFCMKSKKFVETVFHGRLASANTTYKVTTNLEFFKQKLRQSAIKYQPREKVSHNMDPTNIFGDQYYVIGTPESNYNIAFSSMPDNMYYSSYINED